MEKGHYPLIRTIYLYLFALVGLMIVIVAGIRAFTMGLEVFVFKDIDKQTEINYSRPVSVNYIESLGKVEEDESFTESEREAIRNWLSDYERWKEESEEINHVSVQRQKEGASIIASIVVGLPLYLYHWSVIQKESKKEK